MIPKYLLKARIHTIKLYLAEISILQEVSTSSLEEKILYNIVSIIAIH